MAGTQCICRIMTWANHTYGNKQKASLCSIRSPKKSHQNSLKCLTIQLPKSWATVATSVHTIYIPKKFPVLRFSQRMPRSKKKDINTANSFLGMFLTLFVRVQGYIWLVLKTSLIMQTLSPPNTARIESALKLYTLKPLDRDAQPLYKDWNADGTVFSLENIPPETEAAILYMRRSRSIIVC